VWEVLHHQHWLLQWARKAAGRAYVKAFALPQVGEMPRWIENKAQELGGEITHEAAQVLASLVENDTRLAALELDKLLIYANFSRPVNAADIQLLTALSAQANIFEMVDAVAQRSKKKALALLHLLLDQEDEYRIFQMVVRQFRQLIQVRELQEEQKGIEQIQQTLRVPAFVAKKLNYQASRFSMAQLIAMYRRLLALDKAAKTGKMAIDLGLDIFIAEMA